ncbi:MAG: ATP synthase F1 subunit epsilon [Rhodobacteraceae bacterium]|nr:ATP synthase F1 subunit epsilon [Paracoccaceae bacterium]
MADLMQFDLVSPERRVTSVQASAVEIPGATGDFTAGPGHAPFLTTLRPGIVSVAASGGSQEYLVTGGFVEVGPEATSLLAERAVPRAEVTREMLDAVVAEAEAALAATSEEPARAAAELRVADARGLAARLGL